MDENVNHDVLITFYLVCNKIKQDEFTYLSHKDKPPKLAHIHAMIQTFVK